MTDRWLIKNTNCISFLLFEPFKVPSQLVKPLRYFHSLTDIQRNLFAEALTLSLRH